jgi:hypothetical protein
MAALRCAGPVLCVLAVYSLLGCAFSRQESLELISSTWVAGYVNSCYICTLKCMQAVVCALDVLV